MQAKRSAVDVYVTNVTTGKAHQVARITPGEANLVTFEGFADWRGRRKKAITLFITLASLREFVRMHRHQDRIVPLAIDSRTHKKLYGPGNPGYAYVRNDHYRPDAADRHLIGTTGADGDFCTYPRQEAIRWQ